MSEFPALFHYSAEPLGPLRAISQKPRRGDVWTFMDKPNGLWLSVDDAWEAWCKEENFFLNRLAIKHRVWLTGAASRLLWLDDVPKTLAFQDEYGSKLGMPYGFDDAELEDDYRGIDWELVACEYSGILISPYQSVLRFNPMWYYGWDCASGCIWDPSIIRRVELVSDQERSQA